MAIGANIFLELSRQFPRIDNGQVRPISGVAAGLSKIDVKRSRPVARLATDSVLVDPCALRAIVDGFHTAAVTLETGSLHGTLETGWVWQVVPWRHVPFLGRCIPGDGGLCQEPLALDDVRAAR